MKNARVVAGYIIICLIFGTTFVAIKVGLNAGAPPLLFAGLRFVIAGVLSLGWIGVRRIQIPRGAKELRQIALVGLSSTTITFATLFWAEQYVSAGLAATLSAASPLFTLLLMKRGAGRITLIQAIGLVLGLAGVILVMQPGLGLAVGLVSLGAAALLLLGELSAAWGSVRARKVMDGGVHPLALNAFEMLFGGALLLLLSFVTESHGWHLVAPSGWGALLYLAIVGSVIARGLYYWLIARTGPVFPSTWTYVAPIVATGVGAVTLGERVGPGALLGLVLVLSGVITTDDSVFKGLSTWALGRKVIEGND